MLIQISCLDYDGDGFNEEGSWDSWLIQQPPELYIRLDESDNGKTAMKNATQYTIDQIVNADFEEDEDYGEYHVTTAVSDHAKRLFSTGRYEYGKPACSVEYRLDYVGEYPPPSKPIGLLDARLTSNSPDQ